ncbi:MAG: multicopper oxidase domain-containing protein [Rhodococcus sp. (in: high G+C Gram-positive bacteria)]|uniref:multicopper oxidase family protein n=1 Tax=Rhodococcus sp. TaxID=1831 RepID=UPI003BAE6B21
MTSTLSRRALVRGAVVVAGLAVTPAAVRGSGRATAQNPELPRPLMFRSPRLEPFRDAMPIPPSISGSTIEIASRTTSHRFHQDLPHSPALGYGGMDYLGPTIEARAGAETVLHYRNEIGTHPFVADMDTTLHGMSEATRTDPPTSMHLHGGVTPPEFDGHPELITRPGQGYTYKFPNRQPATQLWYHDHAMAITRTNVYAGLAGMYLLRDNFDTGLADNPLGLPSGRHEMPLVLQEKIFTDNGAQSLRSTPIVPEGRWEGGAVGDVGVVNGKAWPELEVDRGLYRFRVINAASYSVWNLYLSNGMRFWVIGAEGGLLDAPVPATHVRLAPAERLDILVDFGQLDPGTYVELRNDEQPPAQAAQIGAVAMPLFCRFKVGTARGFTGPVPHTLRGGRRQPSLLPPVEQPQSFRNLTVSQPFDLRLPPSIMTLNNLRFSSDDIEMPRQRTVEQWNLINVTGDPHPIHIHLVNFRILGRQPLDSFRYTVTNPQPPVGVRWTPSAESYLLGPLIPPQPWESGWKETVRLDPYSVTRLIVRFPTADELGFDPDARFGRSPGAHGGHAAGHGGSDLQGSDLQGYVWHCHILDHEDHDMMLKYRTIA